MEVCESPTAAEPRWVMLYAYGHCGDDFVAADAMTAAESRTSSGRRFRVSVAVAAPPACSFLCLDLVGGTVSAAENESYHSTLIAAHGDTVLFKVAYAYGRSRRDDYFVYRAGGASLPPSLSLLPAGRRLKLEDTGVLRRGGDELLVAQLDVSFYQEPRDTAELSLLRLGDGGGGGGGGWEIKAAVPIVHGDGGKGGGAGLPDWWDSVAAIPVGDRYLCWVNYYHGGFLLYDTAASPPTLRYVRLPTVALHDADDEEEEDGYSSCGSDHDKPNLKCSRNMCAAGASAVRYVSVDPRCCCGGHGWSSCRRSRFAFTVTTWTLTLRTTGGDEPITWVRDGVLDCEELWALPEYGGVRRVPLEYPVVSSDDPDLVCFVVRNDYRNCRRENKVWTVEVNTRSKRIRSVLPCNREPCTVVDPRIPAKLLY